MSGSGRKAIPNVWEWSGGPRENPGVVGGLFGCPRVVGKTSQMSVSVRQTLPDVREWWEALPDVRKTSRISGSGPEALMDVQEALSDVRECSEGPPGCPGGPLGLLGVFVRLSRMSESGRKTLPDIREGLPNIREGFPTIPGYPRGPPTTPGCLAVSPDHSRTFERASHHSWTFGSVF